MPELMLVNPRAKRRRKKAAANPRRRRRRSGRRMSALQRRYFGGRRRRAAAPRRRRRRHSVAAPRRRLRARRNPRVGGGGLSIRSLTSGSFLRSTVMPAAIGAAGAIGIDVLWNMLPVPANLKAGALAPVAKILGAVGIGILASRVLPRRTAELAVASAVTVTLYGIIKQFASAQFPQIAMGEYPSLSYVQAGQYLPDQGSGMGTYISGAGDSTSWATSIYGDETF